ncbi:fibronectin-binding A family protein [Synechococcus sp. PROS-7-1]|uniref:Rqc2 family fibronectin-binding protein n=1 Tax=Synechococcus sp. PROS-7-1 TaxID=1442556 RepID=UPI00164815A4|nr:NFACT RNA binding domain-containing protein [Synechococcus sp. PROS-7-1]QNI85878.1 fibronectin-binding A family protein [Synechococcus sp. PROS-7-1]
MATSTLQVMDLTALKAVLKDLRDRMLPSRFEKAQQPDAHALQLGFRTLQGMVWLELSWQAESARLVQIDAPRRHGGGSTLAQQVQHGLRQLALVELEQHDFERVVFFHLASRPGSPPVRTLVLELMGRHSNLLLLDEQKRITAIGRQVRQHQSRIRPLSTGDFYTPPPPLQGLPPSRDESFDQWKRRLSLLPIPLGRALRETYQGISPALATQLTSFPGSLDSHGKVLKEQLVSDISESQWQRLYERWGCWLHHLNEERFSLQLEGSGFRVWNEPPLADGDQGVLSLRLGCYYQDHVTKRRLSREIGNLQQRLQQCREREQAQRDEQKQRLQDTAGAATLQSEADQLLCQPDPDRDTITRAQKLYHRARRLRRAVPLIEERLQHHDQRLMLIEGSESFLEDLTRADWDNPDERSLQLKDLHQELEELLAPRQRRRRSSSATGQPQPLVVNTTDGLTIQVGRNHRQNEWISLRQARAGDLWFHAQECPGSHVVLKASMAPASEDAIQQAADLAAWFSRARGNRTVPVVMAAVDALQRIPGALPGTVRHRNAELLWAEPDRARRQLEGRELLA